MEYDSTKTRSKLLKYSTWRNLTNIIVRNSPDTKEHMLDDSMYSKFRNAKLIYGNRTVGGMRSALKFWK